MATNYSRSRSREYLTQQEFEKDGWYAIRSAGSHGVADVIAIRPSDCGIPSHFEVKFIQIKVSENLRKTSKTIYMEDEKLPFPINVDLWKFPVKSTKWHKATKKQHAKPKQKTSVR